MLILNVFCSRLVNHPLSFLSLSEVAGPELALIASRKGRQKGLRSVQFSLSGVLWSGPVCSTAALPAQLWAAAAPSRQLQPSFPS